MLMVDEFKARVLACEYLLMDGFVPSEDHAIYGVARQDSANLNRNARLMASSTSEIQAVKYLEFLYQCHVIEPGFRSKAMDAVAGIRKGN